MPEWRTWNPTNQPDTCIWCGRKLRHKPLYGPNPNYDPSKPYIGDNKREVTLGVEPKGGDFKDGFFCGLRCGYMFGEQMAKFGRRLKPDKESDNG